MPQKQVEFDPSEVTAVEFDPTEVTRSTRPQPIKKPKGGMYAIQPPVPPATLGGLGAEFGLGAAEAIGFKPAPTIRETATGTIGNIVGGLREAGQAGYQALTGGGTGRAQELVKGALLAPLAPFQTVAEGVRAGDPNIVAHGMGGVAVAAPAAVSTAGKLTKGGRTAAARTMTVSTPKDLVHSMVNPAQKAFEFGADPVQAIIDVTKESGQSWTLDKLKDRVVRSAKAQEGILRDRLQQHRQMSLEAGVPNVYDASNPITTAIGDMAQRARESGRGTKAFKGFQEGYMERLQRKYKGTHLTPDQILDEKRWLGKEINFNKNLQAAKAANLRQAHLEVYRAYDQMLDGILGEDMAGVNKRWSGLIEAEKMIDDEMFRRSKLPYTGIERWRLKLEPGIKTGLISAAGQHSPVPPPSRPNLQPRIAAKPVKPPVEVKPSPKPTPPPDIDF